MINELVRLLQTFGYPVRRQGSLAGQAYPETFITYWNGETDDGSHYDNSAISFIWYATIYLYSTNSTIIQEKLMAIKALLKQNGWIVNGKGYDVPSDVITHTGRAINVIFLENNSSKGVENA